MFQAPPPHLMRVHMYWNIIVIIMKCVHFVCLYSSNCVKMHGTENIIFCVTYNSYCTAIVSFEIWPQNLEVYSELQCLQLYLSMVMGRPFCVFRTNLGETLSWAHIMLFRLNFLPLIIVLFVCPASYILWHGISILWPYFWFRLHV